MTATKRLFRLVTPASIIFCLTYLVTSPICGEAATWSNIQRMTILPLQQLQLHGGAQNRKTSQWSASPFGISRTQKETQYPIVEDISNNGQAVSETTETKEMIDAFLTRDSRTTFISRVYAILSVQLSITALSVFLFGMNPELSQSMLRNGGAAVPLLSLGVSTVAWFWMCLSTRARREAPIKWQLLALFTLGEAVSVGFISSFYKFRSVLSAMLATAIATLSVSIYTIGQKNPKYDLSQWGMTLSSFGMIFLVYGTIHLLGVFGVIPAGFLPYTEMVYSLFGAVLFSFYLAYHTKLIVGGKHAKYQMNEKDYVFGAMSLYNDIISIFIYILRLIGEDRD